MSRRSIGDVYAFVRQLTVRQPGITRDASHLTGRCSASRSDATTVPLYRLVNRSGLRVSYWARSAPTHIDAIAAASVWQTRLADNITLPNIYTS